MDLGDISELAKAFGPGPALVIVAIVAAVLLVPVLKRERSKSGDAPLISDREVLEFMARQGEININIRARVRALESRHGRDDE